MPRARPARAPAPRPVAILLATSPQVVDALDRLAATGLFGRDVADVAEKLLREKLRELELQGWLRR